MKLDDIKAFATAVRNVAEPPKYDPAKNCYSRVVIGDLALVKRMCQETAANHSECVELCGKLESAKDCGEVCKICDDVATWVEIPGEKPEEVAPRIAPHAASQTAHTHAPVHTTKSHKGD